MLRYKVTLHNANDQQHINTVSGLASVAIIHMDCTCHATPACITRPPSYWLQSSDLGYRTPLLWLSTDLCITDLSLNYCMVDGDGCSHFTGYLDVFILWNTGMKMSVNPGKWELRNEFPRIKPICVLHYCTRPSVLTAIAFECLLFSDDLFAPRTKMSFLQFLKCCLEMCTNGEVTTLWRDRNVCIIIIIIVKLAIHRSSV